MQTETSYYNPTKSGRFTLSGCHSFAVLLLLFLTVSTAGFGARRYTADDSIRIMASIKASADSIDIDYDLSLKRIQDIIILCRQIDFKYGEARGLQRESLVYIFKSRYDTALALANEALSMANKYNYPIVAMNAYDNLGVIYDYLAEYPKSVASYDTALQICSRHPDSITMMRVYSDYAELMTAVRDYDRAEKYYLFCLAFSKSRHMPIDVIKSDLQIARLYERRGEYNKVFPFLYNSVHLCDSLHLQSSLLGNAYVYLGRAHYHVGHFDSVLDYYYKSAALFKENKDDINGAGPLLALGNYFFLHDSNMKKAEYYYLQSLALARKTRATTTEFSCDNNLAEVYERMHNYKMADSFRSAELILDDSLNNQDKMQSMARLTTKFETRQLEDKNAALRQQADMQQLRLRHKDVLLYGSGAFMLLLIGSSVLLMRHNKLRINQKLLLLEQKQLLAQINPHFIFNCLNSVQQFVVQHDIENANKYLVDFGMLMRQTLDNSRHLTIPIYREIEYLENYLSLEALRFEGLFSYKISYEADVDANTTEIPSMIIQPFVENAINHGLIYLEDRPGMLTVCFYKKDGSLFCAVDDNGIGMEHSEQLKEQMFIKHQSKGMELTRQRLALVSKMNGADYEVAVVNKKSDDGRSEGTTITIKFPIKE